MAYTYALIRIDQIRPHPNNARTHSKRQIRQIAVTSARSVLQRLFWLMSITCSSLGMGGWKPPNR